MFENNLIAFKRAIRHRFLKFVLILFLTIVFFLIPKEFLGETYPICLFRLILNKECLGCGTTRAFWSVLHLNFAEAYEYNKLVVITFPLLGFCLLKWIYKKQY